MISALVLIFMVNCYYLWIVDFRNIRYSNIESDNERLKQIIGVAITILYIVTLATIIPIFEIEFEIVFTIMTITLIASLITILKVEGSVTHVDTTNEDKMLDMKEKWLTEALSKTLKEIEKREHEECENK